MLLKDKLIKALGGYTSKEYIRIERKYQGLLDSKTNDKTAKICNEYIWRLLKALDNYAKELYGSSFWAKKMYNVIHNNMLRVFVRYVNSDSPMIYTIDTTLDGDREFQKIMSKENIVLNENY